MGHDGGWGGKGTIEEAREKDAIRKVEKQIDFVTKGGEYRPSCWMSECGVEGKRLAQRSLDLG